MFEKTYQRKPHTTKAIQYDGSAECAEAFANEYLNIVLNGSGLYFEGNYGHDDIYEGDWILIEGMSAIDIIDRDVFGDMYEEVK